MDPPNATAVSMAASASLSSFSAEATAAFNTAEAEAEKLVIASGSSTWLGLLGRIILSLLQIASTILVWSLKLTTISVPTLLFTLFSTSLTFTMNATTL